MHANTKAYIKMTDDIDYNTHVYVTFIKRHTHTQAHKHNLTTQQKTDGVYVQTQIHRARCTHLLF